MHEAAFTKTFCAKIVLYTRPVIFLHATTVYHQLKNSGAPSVESSGLGEYSVAPSAACVPLNSLGEFHSPTPASPQCTRRVLDWLPCPARSDHPPCRCGDASDTSRPVARRSTAGWRPRTAPVAARRTPSSSGRRPSVAGPRWTASWVSVWPATWSDDDLFHQK